MRTNFILSGVIVVLLVFLGIVVLTPRDITVKTEVDVPDVGSAGDIARTARIEQKGITAATNTLCALYHADGRDRIMTKVYSWNADDTAATQDQVASYTLSVATSSSASATSTVTSRAFVKDAAWATSTSGVYFSSSTPTTYTSDGYGELRWPTATYLLFEISNGVTKNATTSTTITGFCGVEYYPDM